jgi:hypothetical protein
VAEDRALVGVLPQGVAFAAADVQAERLVVGQELLEEPGEIPQGARLTSWLLQVLRGSGPAGGAPEAVKPIYVRSPDADLHITKMKDPFADASGRRAGAGGR